MNLLERRYRHELVDLIEEVRIRARNLGLSTPDLYGLQAPFALRADAWLARVDRLLAARCR